MPWPTLWESTRPSKLLLYEPVVTLRRGGSEVSSTSVSPDQRPATRVTTSSSRRWHCRQGGVSSRHSHGRRLSIRIVVIARRSVLDLVVKLFDEIQPAPSLTDRLRYRTVSVNPSTSHSFLLWRRRRRLPGGSSYPLCRRPSHFGPVRSSTLLFM